MTTISFNRNDHPHRRLNPLTGEWVLVSPHRAKRPWQGQQESVEQTSVASHDATCFLCSGNTRINGEENPEYHNTFVFNNDFAALKNDNIIAEPSTDPLFQQEVTKGLSKVICYSPDHSKTLPQLSLPAIENVISAWIKELELLSQTYQWVQVFENKGNIMGCSNPHPHGQIWAHDHLPTEITKADISQKNYYKQHDSPMLLDYVTREQKNGERIVVETEHWIAVVPYWAAWPFETLLLPKTHITNMNDLSNAQQSDLAIALKKLTSRYDNLFNCSFPYSMGWHGAPFNTNNNEHWQLHAHFYPPLLRSATVRKFMVGYEMLCESQRDITPEQASQYLQNVSDVHYSEQNL